MTQIGFNRELLFRGDSLVIDRISNIGLYFRRVILIANNNNLDKSSIMDLKTTDEDLIIQFNGCVHSDVVMDMPGYHIICFRRHLDTLRHWGFPCPQTLVESIEKISDRVWFVFTGIDPVESIWPQFGQRPRFIVLRDSEAMRCMPDYPLVHGIRFSAPSTGFLVMSVLLALREAGRTSHFFGRAFLRPRALAPKSSRYRIELIGFEPGTGPGFWVGHNWNYERNWYEERRAKMLKDRSRKQEDSIERVQI